MQAYFEDVKVVGNIGIPYTSVAADTTDETVTVAEISSFQLETAVDFHPQVSAILNITPDHLNRHHTMECYIETKESITKNQQKEDVCVRIMRMRCFWNLAKVFQFGWYFSAAKDV